MSELIKLGWTDAARDDLLSSVGYIGERNPMAARSVFEAVRSSAESLTAVLHGRPGRVIGTYEKVVAGLPYILVYSVEEEMPYTMVTILRLIHTSRDWSADSWPD